MLMLVRSQGWLMVARSGGSCVRRWRSARITCGSIAEGALAAQERQTFLTESLGGGGGQRER
jgi:hypothetical protein